MTRLFTTLFFCVFLFACGESEVDERMQVDTILHNGKVITIDAELSIASAVAINGTDIVAVGGEELLESHKSSNTIDLGGKVLMPGYVDLTKTRSIEELKAQVSTKAIELGSGEWITGYGWSESDLDEAAPDNPVLLTRAGGHSAVANSMALRQAEVTTTTAQPEGGVIERGEDGELARRRRGTERRHP
jgi:predicted amidohydrolase YtcJ